jgi:outer membrane protein assembly factor BamB
VEYPKGLKKIHIWIGLIGLVSLVAFARPDYFLNYKKSIHHSDLREIWRVQTEKRVLSPPIIVDDVIILGCYDGVVMGVSSETGKILWSKTFSDFVFSLTSDKNGVVYAGTGLHSSTIGHQIALEAHTGKIIWQQQFSGHLEEPPFIDEKQHQLWLGTGPGSLWSLDTRDGSILWHKDIGHLDATPLLKDNILYVPAQINETEHKSKFYALNAHTGEIIWELPLEGQPWASPIWDEQSGLILSNTAKGQIGVHKDSDKGWAQGISLAGNLVWQRSIPNMALTPNNHFPERNSIVSIVKSGEIVSLATNDGHIQWATKVGKGFATGGEILNYYQEDLIAVTTEEGIFLIIDVTNGQPLFSKKFGKSYGGGVVAKDNKIFVTTDHLVIGLKEKE